MSSQKGQARLHRYRLPFTEMLSNMELTIVHESFHFELASLLRSEASVVAKKTQLGLSSARAHGTHNPDNHPLYMHRR